MMEYKVIDAFVLSSEDLETLINEYAKDGWEVVCGMKSYLILGRELRGIGH
jgi:hypothetical protein